MQLDTAESRPVYIGTETPTETVLDSEHQAVWNVTQDHLACIASNGYKIIQHQELLDAFKDACGRLNLEPKIKVQQHGDRAYIDVLFPKAKMVLKQKGEEFFSGFRIINSYDKTTGIIVVARLMRMVCSNGMIVPVMTAPFKYRHNQPMADNFAGYFEKALAETINRQPTLQKLVNEGMQDSIEWDAVLKITKNLFLWERHVEAIKSRLEPGRPATRWELYNAITHYATHGEHITPHLDMWLQKRAQKVLTNNQEALMPLLEVN